VHTLSDPASLHLGVVSYYTLAFLSSVGPLLAWRAHRRMAAGGRDPQQRGRLAVYLGALLWLWVLLVLCWGAARESGMTLFPAWRPRPLDAVVGLASLMLGLLTLVPGRSPASRLGRERVRAVAPRGPRERIAFYLLCLSAGVGEEVVYRGVLFTLFHAVIGSWWLAALAAATVFGAVHHYQGPRSAVLAGAYGFRDHLVVGITGTLWVAIVVHVVHDAVLGTVVGVRARREEGPPPGAPADRLDDLQAELGRRGVTVDPEVVAEVRRQMEAPEA
jgi:membrane protease YdiL (CAAX protease family)